MLDEPFSGLDPIGQAVVEDLMMELAATGATLLLSSHDLERVERFCAYVALISHGRLRFDGSVEALRARHPQLRRRVLELAEPCPTLQDALPGLTPVDGDPRRLAAALDATEPSRCCARRSTPVPGSSACRSSSPRCASCSCARCRPHECCRSGPAAVLLAAHLAHHSPRGARTDGAEGVSRDPRARGDPRGCGDRPPDDPRGRRQRARRRPRPGRHAEPRRCRRSYASVRSRARGPRRGRAPRGAAGRRAHAARTYRPRR